MAHKSKRFTLEYRWRANWRLIVKKGTVRRLKMFLVITDIRRLSKEHWFFHTFNCSICPFPFSKNPHYYMQIGVSNFFILPKQYRGPSVPSPAGNLSLPLPRYLYERLYITNLHSNLNSAHAWNKSTSLPIGAACHSTWVEAKMSFVSSLMTALEKLNQKDNKTGLMVLVILVLTSLKLESFFTYEDKLERLYYYITAYHWDRFPSSSTHYCHFAKKGGEVYSWPWAGPGFLFERVLQIQWRQVSNQTHEGNKIREM